MSIVYTLCPEKNIPDIFDCNFESNYKILIIFVLNIPDTTGYQTTDHLTFHLTQSLILL